MTEDSMVFGQAAADAHRAAHEMGDIWERMDALARTARDLAEEIDREIERRGRPQSLRQQMQIALLQAWGQAGLQMVAQYLSSTLVQASAIERTPRLTVHRADGGRIVTAD